MSTADLRPAPVPPTPRPSAPAVLLNTKETAARIGLPRSTFDVHVKRGTFRQLLARSPVGQRIYDAAAVERYVQGQLQPLVRRRRSA